MFYQLFCDVVVCPSELAKKDLEKKFNCRNGVIIPNPMLDRFKIRENKLNDGIIISYLGRLDDSKGVLDLVESFIIYKKQFIYSKIILNIAGTGSQEKLIKERIKWNDAIYYLGGLPYNEIDDYLSSSHYVIIPSKFDNLPTVGLEAMMNQTPLLISNTTGLTCYLTDGKECFKFDPTVNGMVALFRKVEGNFGSCNHMGVNARNTFLKKFSMENYCYTFEKMIE
jgi:glycosyltransferase involved in cell wall biosynthesis